jgi:hypothetical protein
LFRRAGAGDVFAAQLVADRDALEQDDL